MNLFQEDGKLPNSHFYHANDGYFYTKLRGSASSIYFKCNRSTCNGKGVYVFGYGFEHTLRHNHAPDPLHLEVLRARRSIVYQAGNTSVHRPLSSILTEERAGIPNRYVRLHLTMRRLRPAMQRARRDAFPDLPENLAGLTAILQDPDWAKLTETLDSEDNMYLGSVWCAEGSHSIVFISKRCMEILRVTTIIFADGTFFIKPSVEGCYQVFTIVTIYGNTVIPLVWCLMERKTEAAYIAVLSLLRAHLVRWQFVRVICDFEDAMINAFVLVFQVIVQGCLFHAVKAMSMWARINIGVPFIYLAEVQVIINLCCSLALLPLQLLQTGMNIIGEMALSFHPILYTIIRPFLCYVQTEWLNHPNRGTTMSVCGSDHRTNNASESNNSRMKRKFLVAHPNTFHFLGELSHFEDSAIDDLHSLGLGLIPTRHRKVSVVNSDESIRQNTRQLLQNPDPNDEDIFSFLMSVTSSVANVMMDNLV